MSQTSRADARSIFDAAVAAAQPEAAMRSADLSHLIQSAANAERIIVVGGGKASAGMVHALESHLVDYLDRINGIVNVPDDLAAPTHQVILNPARPAKVNEPTLAACQSAERMLALVRQATGNDLVIVLLSGGGSALLPLPVDDVTLHHKVEITRALSRAGATIQELNCVRKHLSQIKGGRLAEAAKNAGSIWSLIISDVVGDPLDVIASGPTAPDSTSFADAIQVLQKYQLETKVPVVFDFLKRGAKGLVPETPKSLPPNVHNQIIASNSIALKAAEQSARTLGYEVITILEPVVGDVGTAAKKIALQIRSLSGKRNCLLFGGETTVNVGSATGLGGRNQELTMELAIELSNTDLTGITFLCCGTDGEDGPTNAAGACVDAEVWSNRTFHKSGPEKFLKDHDSFNFFEPIGGLVQTGLTGTNVMDIGVILVQS